MPTPRFNELSSGLVSATLTDANGDPIAGSDLTALTLTLTDVDTGQIINHRDVDNILTSPSPVDEVGALTLALDAEDNVIVTPRRQIERHRALLQFEWADGSSYEEIMIEVKNLRTIGSGSPN